MKNQGLWITGLHFHQSRPLLVSTHHEGKNCSFKAFYSWTGYGLFAELHSRFVIWM